MPSQFSGGRATRARLGKLALDKALVLELVLPRQPRVPAAGHQEPGRSVFESLRARNVRSSRLRPLNGVHELTGGDRRHGEAVARAARAPTGAKRWSLSWN
jgi:hypothetical protein